MVGQIPDKKAVLLIGFNRPDLTAEVLERIHSYSPPRLYLACDGPRKSRHEDNALVQETRLTMRKYGAHMEAFTKFEDHNLGLYKAVTSAIDWFFSNEEEGIILEDDCIPREGFFELMSELLNKYRDNPEIWGATGSNPYHLSVAAGQSYSFVQTALIWGWASWADRWQNYDRDLTHYSAQSRALGRKVWPHRMDRHSLKWHLDRLSKEATPTTWDYQLAWTVVANRGLWCLPRLNLIDNKGFRDDSTHRFSSRPTPVMAQTDPLSELNHPPFAEPNRQLTRLVLRHHHNVFSPLSLNFVRDAYRHFRRFLHILPRSTGINRSFRPPGR